MPEIIHNYYCINSHYRRGIIEKESPESCTMRSKPGDGWWYEICNLCDPINREPLRKKSELIFKTMKRKSIFFDILKEAGGFNG